MVAGRNATGEADADGDGLAATREGAGLTAAEGEPIRSGVGIGVRLLRVSVAAAPGTGVGSGLSRVEQPDASAASATNSRALSTSLLKYLAQVVPQLLRAAWMPQLAQRLGFDLADALSRHAELAADLFQRALPAIVEAEAQGNDAALALRERAEHVVHGIAQQRLGRFLDRRNRLGVLDEIAQLAILIVADWRREAAPGGARRGAPA